MGDNSSDGFLEEIIRILHSFVMFGLHSTVYILGNIRQFIVLLEEFTEILDTRRVLSHYSSARKSMDLRPEYKSRTEKFRFYHSIHNLEYKEKLQEVHEFLDESEGFESDVIYLLVVMWISENKSEFNRFEERKYIQELFSQNAIDIEDMSDEQTRKFLTAYANAYNEGKARRLDSSFMTSKPVQDLEFFKQRVKSKFNLESLEEKLARETHDRIDEREVLDYLKRVLKSEINADALFKQVMGETLTDIKAKIEESYNAYVILNQKHFEQDTDTDRRQNFMDQFEYAFATGGKCRYKNKDDKQLYGTNQHLNVIVVSEPGLSKDEVERRYYEVVEAKEDWKDTVATHIIPLTLGDLETPDNSFSGVNNMEPSIDVWATMADINNIDIQTLTEHIQSYMEVEEILTVIPICFFNTDCPTDIEDAFFKNHYNLCDKHNIHRLQDWVDKDINPEMLASDIEEEVTNWSHDEVVLQIRDMLEEVENYCTEMESEMPE